MFGCVRGASSNRLFVVFSLDVLYMASLVWVYLCLFDAEVASLGVASQVNLALKFF